MKILYVIANMARRYGGPQQACIEMAKHLAHLGHDVSIYTTNQDGPTELDVPTDSSVFEDGIEIRYFPIQPPRFWGTSLPMAKALRKKIQEVDIVHIYSLYMFHNAVAGYYCRHYSVPYMIHPHGTLDPVLYKRHRFQKTILELLFENRNIKQAVAIHHASEEEKNLAQPHTFKTPDIVVPYALNVSEYENLPEPGMFRAQYPEICTKKIILYFSRISFKKGLDILVKAFATVARKRADVHLVIAGPDNEGLAKNVRGWLTDEDMLERATFTGLVQGKAKLAVLQDADIFVLPSYSESFGIAVIEAMVCGMPVVISDQVNICKEVELSQSGLVAPCDAEPVSKHILELLENPEKAKKMGDNGKAFVKKYFDWSSAALEMEKAYNSVLSGEKPDINYFHSLWKKIEGKPPLK